MNEKLYPRLHSWWLLCLATVITVAIVAASQLFTQRISRMLDQQAAELMAADLMIQSNDPLADDLQRRAQALGLQTATTVMLRTAIFIDDEPQLIELKAVSDAYPLRGMLEIKDELFASAVAAEQGPAAGELWIDSRIAAQLKTRLDLGTQVLPATRILHFEPDRGGSLFTLAPRVMMHLDDLPATGLLVPGSRARYRLLVAGDPEPVRLFADEIKPLLAAGQRLQTLENARPEMRRALERTRKFFAFSIVLTLVIAMVATAITARYAASRESSKVAVLRTFGISSRRLLGHYLMQLIKVWLWALPFGLLGGYLAQYPIDWALGYWFGSRLPETGMLPYLTAALVGLVALTGFSLPSVVTVLDAPPMQVLRSGVRQQLSRARGLLLAAASLASLFVVLLLIVQQMKLAVILLLIIVLVGGFIPLVLRLILRGLRQLAERRFWLGGYIHSRLLSPPRNALYVMSGFSLTLLSVLLISQVKDELIRDWETQLPADKPNYFLVNIPTAEVDQLRGFMQQHSISTSVAYPLVRSRLRAINGVDVKSLEFKSRRSRHLVNHVFNMSASAELPADNRIVQGSWVSSDDELPGFSVEEGMAQELELELGDIMRFSVGGSTFEAEVRNIRSVMWENFQPNFYVLATPGLLASKPQTWLMSAYVAESNRQHLKDLLQRFPTVTLLDISEIMQRIKGIIERASLTLEFFFLFATLSAIIVLLSALNTASRIRTLEIALLQALGADHPQKRWSQLVEFAAMGLLVGVFAALFANLTGWIVGRWFFDLDFTFSPRLWITSLLLSVTLITSLGMLFIRGAFSTSPMRLLRS